MIGLSPNSQLNILFHWFDAFPEDDYRFSTCFGEETGFLELGVNPEDEKLTADFESKYDGSSKVYQLTSLEQLSFGSVNILGEVESVIFDTGSNVISLP